VSENVLSVIPTDPYWRPGKESADRAAVLADSLCPADGLGRQVDVRWTDSPVFIDCGQNLERIGCPVCGASVDVEWWLDLMDERSKEEFAALAVRVPCCGAASSVNALDYTWPCGLASFEIALWNPDRDVFDAEELAALGEALGHPVRTVLARI
jgi:hypothetical protein